MKDFRIGDLGGAKNIGGITNKDGKVKQKNTAAIGQNFMVAGLRKFTQSSATKAAPANTGIQDLNLPPHMKTALADVAAAQKGIRADRPLIPDGRNLEIRDQDYIPDEAFQDKQFAEV